MAENKKQSKLIIIIAAVLAVAVIGYFVTVPQNATTPSSTSGETIELTEESVQAEPTQDTAEQATEANPATDTAAAPAQAATIDVAAAIAPRVHGNPDAPITISEHSSLTCGHCGAFHTQTYPTLKAEYIDTGKVKVVFNDFPLNGPALHASMVARCLPAERHAAFTQLLFETQDKWAYDAVGYLNYLKQNAQLAGLGAEAFDACINNAELRDFITKGIQEAQTKHKVSSTPTFVINDTTVVSGALPYAEFKKAIDEALTAGETATPAETPVEAAPESVTE